MSQASSMCRQNIQDVLCSSRGIHLLAPLYEHRTDRDLELVDVMNPTSIVGHNVVQVASWENGKIEEGLYTTIAFSSTRQPSPRPDESVVSRQWSSDERQQKFRQCGPRRKRIAEGHRAVQCRAFCHPSPYMSEVGPTR
nr:hypothetical protein CFP56_73412 [Quercus suber]